MTGRQKGKRHWPPRALWLCRLKTEVREFKWDIRNGRVTPGIYQSGVINRHAALKDGDPLAFSGPVPQFFQLRRAGRLTTVDELS